MWNWLSTGVAWRRRAIKVMPINDWQFTRSYLHSYGIGNWILRNYISSWSVIGRYGTIVRDRKPPFASLDWLFPNVQSVGYERWGTDISPCVRMRSVVPSDNLASHDQGIFCRDFILSRNSWWRDRNCIYSYQLI